MTPLAAAQLNERQNVLLREQVMHELLALRLMLEHLMRPTPPGVRAVARVGGDGFY